MSGDPFTAREATRESARKLLNEIDLPRNSNGQYHLTAAETYISAFNATLRQVYHPDTKGDGMHQLALEATNELNQIKTSTYADPKQLLLDSKKEAAALQKQTGVPEEPAIQNISEATEVAITKNYAIQATIGAKVGAAEAITDKVGAAITDQLLKDPTTNTKRSPDDWTLFELQQLILTNAIRPNSGDLLSDLVQLLKFQFDFRKTITQNMEQLQAAGHRLTSIGIPFPPGHKFLIIISNVTLFAKQEAGRDFASALQKIREKYTHSHVHTDASITDTVALLTPIDAIRNLMDAPAPETYTESANAITDAANAFQQAWQEYTEDHEEEALAAQSDSDSSQSTRRSSKRSTRRDDRRGRSKSRGRRRFDSDDVQDLPVTCPHCKKHKRKTAHPWLEESKCGWNPKYKGWRPEYICEKLEIDYKPKYKFSKDMGGTRDE